MKWLQRFVWWKCVFWFALGIGLGAAISVVLPDPGPGAAKRISAEEFVSLFQYPLLTDGEHISSITIFPEHIGVQMLKFRLEGKPPTDAYVYAQCPFVLSSHLKAYERTVAIKRAIAAQQMGRGIYLGQQVAVAVLQAKEAQAHAPAFKDYESADDFLKQMQAQHSDLRVRRAWWADRIEQRSIAMAAGGLIIGTLCSLLLAHRSKEEQAAFELMRTASAAPALPSAPAPPSEDDLRRVRELDEALARNLTGTDAAGDTKLTAAETAQAAKEDEPSQPAIAKLSDQPLDAPVEQTKEQKDYAGDFYPTVVRAKPKAGSSGFSLVEMVVVIGILTVILAILLPALARARLSADTITCANNLHSIGQGFTMYLQTYGNTFPASYTYIGQKIVNGVQTPTDPAAGYVHWSSLLYGSGWVPQAMFTCPAMDRGGLPPTNTTPDNMNPGQVCPGAAAGVVDQQAIRLAYTVNEALCPRNKFVKNFQSAQRIYRFVKANEVSDASDTILATEMVDNGNMVSYNDNNSGWIMSHRPIDGFCNSTTPDAFLLPVGAGFRQCTDADIDPDPVSETSSNSRLDLVGRNHGIKQSYPDNRLSNFVYVDGHVETKSIYDTVSPNGSFQWGSQFYSLVPNNDFQSQ